MNRAQLAHVLRAACQVSGDPDILVIGSQSILASYDEADLPAPATASIEADVAFMDDAGDAKADLVDGALGELSPFHQRFGYYAQGVSVTTAVLPHGWHDRLVRWSNQSTGEANAAFLEKHDLVVSKLVAFREKDRAFAEALIEAGLVDVAVIEARIAELPREVAPQVRAVILSFLDRWS